MEEAVQAERCKRKALGHWLVQNIFTVEIAERLHHSGPPFYPRNRSLHSNSLWLFRHKNYPSGFCVSSCFLVSNCNLGFLWPSAKLIYKKLPPKKLSSDTPVRFLQPAWFTSWIPKSRESLEEVRPAWLCIAQTHQFWESHWICAVITKISELSFV